MSDRKLVYMDCYGEIRITEGYCDTRIKLLGVWLMFGWRRPIDPVVVDLDGYRNQGEKKPRDHQRPDARAN